MYRTHFLSNNPAKIAEILYKKYANKLNHLKTVSKKMYYCKQFNIHRNNLKAKWKVIGTLIKWKTKGQTSPFRIIMNNKTFTNKLDIAEQFNKYFISVGPSLPYLLRSHQFQVLLCSLLRQHKFVDFSKI